VEKKRFRSEKNFVEKQRARDRVRGNIAWTVRMPVEIHRYRETERTKILRVFVEKLRARRRGFFRAFLEKQRAKSEENLSVLFVQKQRARESVEIKRYGD
jgi:hypothetical protein